MQACVNSSTQTTIELNHYTHGIITYAYNVYNILVDSNMNQYLIYSNSTFDNLHVTKRHSNGSYGWSFEYETLQVLAYYRSVVVSSDGSTLTVMNQRSNSN